MQHSYDPVVLYAYKSFDGIGDETVPITSAKAFKEKAKDFATLSGFDHQNAYNHGNVIDKTLDQAWIILQETGVL